MTKKFVFLFLVIGSFIGGYIPALWGDSAFSMASVLCSALGGFAGIYLGFKLGQRFD
jgi:hypothetical protein